MLTNLKQSELIINPDGSIYHLNLLPSDIGHKIILVGDQDRVPMVSKYFDTIDVKKHKREFVTHSGYYRSKKITCISTGIGTDNIDIVLNELDALVNIDFETRNIKNQFQQLQFVRIGTSGSICEEIDVNSILISSHGMGLDGLMHFYHQNLTPDEHELLAQIELFIENNKLKIPFPYIASSNKVLFDLFSNFQSGITLTANGFYGPQGRQLRAQVADSEFLDVMRKFSFQNYKITNIEMETAGIYGLAKLLGHQALSINLILANRVTGSFSKSYQNSMEDLIQLTLDKFTQD